MHSSNNVTYVNICSCGFDNFIILSLLWQVGETEPFVLELLKAIPSTIMDLENHQIHSFYESVSITFHNYLGTLDSSNPVRDAFFCLNL